MSNKSADLGGRREWGAERLVDKLRNPNHVEVGMRRDTGMSAGFAKFYFRVIPVRKADGPGLGSERFFHVVGSVSNKEGAFRVSETTNGFEKMSFLPALQAAKECETRRHAERFRLSLEFSLRMTA